MKFKIDISQVQTMMQLNLASIVIIGFCEIFAIAVFIDKGFNHQLAKWKYILFAAIVGLISLLLLAAILLFIHFLRLKRKNNK